MSRWNPNLPGVAGMEYRVRNLAGSAPASTVQAGAKGIAVRVPSTVTETIGDVAAFVQGGGDPWVMLAEAFEAGSEAIGPVTTVTYEPNNSADVNPAWVSTAGTFQDAINTGVIDLASYVYVANNLGTGPYSFELEFGAAGFPANKRVLNVRIGIVLGQNDAFGGGTGGRTVGIQIAQKALFGYLPIGGSSYPAGSVSGSPSAGDTTVTTVLSTGEIFPVDAQPWTVAHVQQFDSSTGRVKITANLPNVTGGTNQINYRIYRVWVEVDYCDENRVMTQVMRKTNTDPDWVHWVPRKPSASTNLSKVSGTDLTFLFRQPVYGSIGPGTAAASLVFAMPYLRGVSDVPDPGLIYYPNVTLDARGAVTGLVAVTTDLIGLYMATTAPVASVDSQPFVETIAVEVTGTVQQEITGAAADYSAVVFSVYPVGSVGDLTIDLKRRSDDNLMASAALSVDDWAEIAVDPLYGLWKVAQVDFAVPVTLAAVQYYLDFTSSGSGSWFVQGLSTSGELGAGTYAGTTDVATFAGADVPTADLTVMVMEPIDPITDATAAPVGCT